MTKQIKFVILFTAFEKGGGKVETGVRPEITISLAAARVNAGLTQAEVAEKMGVAVNTVVNWEKYKTSMTLQQARAIEELYQMPLKYIRT